MKQHIQLPNKMTEGTSLTTKDLLVYLALKSFNNSDNECYPSLKAVANKIGASINTVSKCINNLIHEGYISRVQLHRGFKYTFSSTKNFEPFTYDFLERTDYSFREKAYLAGMQQYMYIDSTNHGTTTYTNLELGKKLKLSHDTISKIDKELQMKNALTIIDTNAKDIVTGCSKREKIFSLEKFGQGVVYALKNHEARIQDNEQSIEKLKKDNESLKKTQDILISEIQTLKRKYENSEETLTL